MQNRLAAGGRYIVPSETPHKHLAESDARDLPFDKDSVHLVVTSPPYWQKRDYGFDEQIGQEKTVDEFVDTLLDVLDELERVLHPSGSVFLNIGDTYHNKELAGVPGVFARKVREETDWLVRNDIIWSKPNSMPDPSSDRLAQQHEHIFHLAPCEAYYYDLFGYKKEFEGGGKAGDVWEMGFDRNTGGHLAPFPEQLARRAIILAAPPAVCNECGQPYERVTEREIRLDESRDQARRAMEIYEDSELSEEHIKAIWAVGITDVGKSREVQDGSGRNRDEIEELAGEAKEVLGGYFREFTYPKRKTTGWKKACECDTSVNQTSPGTVLDPFTGTGTTVEVALRNGLNAYGTDLEIPDIDAEPLENMQVGLNYNELTIDD